MARPKSTLVMWGQYLAARAVASLAHSFPVRENLQSAAALGGLIGRLNPKRRERAEANLAASFPDWPEAQVRRVTRQSMEHMMQLFMVDALVTPRVVTSASWPEYVTLGDRIDELLDRLLCSEPMILITAHVGNWELLGHFLALMGYPVIALARPIDNPLINDWLMGIREATGTRILTKWGATPVLQHALQTGGRVAFIADQNAGNQGMFIPFFGRLASSYKSIGLLAMRYKVPIVAGHAQRLDGRLRYRLNCVDIIEPEDWQDQPDPLFYITARYNRAIETMIRNDPGQYLWLHRRWKSRPKHEREGRPMPTLLAEKIRSLPWLSDEEAEAIIDRSNAAALGAH